MITPEFVRMMTAYTMWQNESIHGAADGLSAEARQKERGAFFGSIEKTLNHLLWADQLWLHRFSGSEAPAGASIAASVEEGGDWSSLLAARRAFDKRLKTWAVGITTDDLEGNLSWYSGAMGQDISRPRALLITHFFNHGTHHRGQVHAMLTAAGAKPDDTDIPFMPRLMGR